MTELEIVEATARKFAEWYAADLQKIYAMQAEHEQFAAAVFENCEVRRKALQFEIEHIQRQQEVITQLLQLTAKLAERKPLPDDPADFWKRGTEGDDDNG